MTTTSVLHICTDFWPSTGGIEQFVLELASRSQAQGMRVGVLCLNRTNAHREPLPAEDSIRGVCVYRVPFVDLRFYKPVALPMRLLKDYDVLHVHGVGAQLDWVASTRFWHGRPIVASTHGGIFHTSALATLKKLYFFGLQRLTMQAVDVVAACSREDETLFKAIAPRVVLLENAVDTDRFLALRPEAKERGRCLYVGRLSANKALPDLLRAFAVAARATACRLRIVGRDVDGERARLQTLVAELGIVDHVAFVGEVSDECVTRELERAAIFISASRYEGFGLSAIEAKAAGCALVLQANAAFRTLFDRDVQATLVDFSDAHAAGDAITRAAATVDAAELQSSRHEVAIYSWQRKVGEWRSLYRRLARPEEQTSPLAS